MNDLNASKIDDNKEICTVLVPAIISKLKRYRIFICILNRNIKENNNYMYPGKQGAPG